MTYEECKAKYPIGTKVNYTTHEEKVTRIYMNKIDLDYWRQRAARYGNFTIESDSVCSYIKKVEKYDEVNGYIITEEGCTPAINDWNGWRPIIIDEELEILWN